MSEFYVRRGEELIGPIQAEELHRSKVGPTDLVRYGDEGPWSHLATIINTNEEARGALEDGVDPDMPGPERWQERSIVEFTWPAMLLAADALWFFRAASLGDSLSSWLTPLSLVATFTVAVVGLLRRRPWGWILSALACGATAIWLLAPLITAPSAGFILWFGLNFIAAVFLFIRSPRGPALDWPHERRRLLLLYSSDPRTESRPFRYRTDRAGPRTALIGAVAFFAIVLTGVTVYHSFRYPGIELPVSLIPRGGDVWGRLAAFGVYGLMVALAVVFSLRGRSVMASLGMIPGQGLKRALWTGFRVFLALYLVLLASRWTMRTVEVIERHLQGPDITAVDDTATAQVRTAVESALDRTRRPGSLSLQHLWLLIVALLIGPVCEEVFFRGLIFGGLRRSFPFWAAALLSSAVFTASHGWGMGWGLAGPVLWLQIYAGGLAAAYAYELTGTLAAPVALHALWNAAQTATQFISS